MYLTISPSTLHVIKPYSITVTLLDTDAGSAGIASKTITFKATSPITIPSGTTNGSAVYNVSGLLAPPSKGYYDIYRCSEVFYHVIAFIVLRTFGLCDI
jgi:hypothetical protein